MNFEFDNLSKRKKRYILIAVALLALILLSICTHRAEADFDACHTGSWYDPAREGEGLVVEVLPSAVLAYWFTYAYEEGEWGAQDWFLMVGQRDGSGAVFFDDISDFILRDEQPLRVTEFPVGSGSLTVVDAQTLRFDWTLGLDASKLPNSTPWCLHFRCRGSVELRRLTTIEGC